MAEGCCRKRKEDRCSYRERTRSSTAWHQDIRDFDRTARSTTAQSLFVSHPLPFLLPGSNIPLSFFFFSLSLSLLLSLAFSFSFLSLLAPTQLPHLSLALSTPHSVGTHRTWGPHPFPTFFGARLLLPFAPPLSRPDLGVSWLHVACPNDVSERTGTTAI